MIIVKAISKEIFGENLFEDVSFSLNRGDKVGLVGVNGSGKSTLLKIILKELEPDTGSVKYENERIGYLPQELPFKEDDTIEGFLKISDKERIKTILSKVNLENVPANFKVSQLSGGQKTRLALAGILLLKPTSLLLDEPTNHLDFEGLRWLEGFIRDFKGGILIISHDRRLLDNSVKRIIEIDKPNHRVNEYFGGYTEYVIEREKRFSLWESEYKRQQKEKKRMELWLVLKKQEAHFHPDPHKGKRIRAMEKRLQKEIYDQEIEKPKSLKSMNVDLKGETHSSKLILRFKGVSKSFFGRSILQGIDFEIRGREHVCLMGANGSGKTTILKMTIGEIEPDSGEIRLGEGVRIGYFSQEHEDLDPSKTVIEEFVGSLRTNLSSKSSRTILGSFLFSGESVFKKVADLSLGERVRLIFAKLTNRENELLVLDEPTNHLDIQSREAIEEALLNYQGAILTVSHDRYFLDRISIDRFLALEKGTLDLEDNFDTI